MWPHRAAFRRAARWDGVYPITVDEDYGFTPLDPGVFAEIVGYVARHRPGPEPFDAAAGGSLIDAPDRAAEVTRFVEAGATWWIENAPFPTRPLDEFLAYVEAGPPR
jgi:hypothetical protein